MHVLSDNKPLCLSLVPEAVTLRNYVHWNLGEIKVMLLLDSMFISGTFSRIIES